MNSGPARQETLTYAQLEHILLQAFAELRPLHVVVFAGGEPMLLGEDLYKAITLCKRHGAVTRIVTNAYWATSPEAARLKIRELRTAGLDELNLSTDDYHLSYISLQRLRYAWDVAKGAGFLSVVLANCSGPNSWLSPQRVEQLFGSDAQADGASADGDGPMQRRFSEAGESLTQIRLPGKTTTVLSNASVQRLGRGLETLQDDDLPAQDASELIEHGGCPWALRSAAISPKGHLLACCGFELEDNPILDYGDINRRDLKDLLDQADADLITNMIAILGPPKIKQVLEQHWPDEVSFPRRYNTYCEVCNDLVHIRKNREALYRHQAAFLDGVLSVRERLETDYSDGKRVRLPFDLVVKPVAASAAATAAKPGDADPTGRAP